jgi:hypothetical protein
MDARDELLTIAEISIGIAGFSGVIAAFLHRDVLHPVDRARFVMLFGLAFTTVGLAYVPIVVSRLFEEAVQIWTYSSAVLVAVWCATVTLGYLFLIPELRRDDANRTGYQGVLIAVPSVLNLAAQCLNVGGWLWDPGFLAYLFGLFVYLYASGLMFIFVIMYRPSGSGVQQGVESERE